ncbi:DUF4268 domain-containing protein [Polynucleobacter sp. JS-Safj-400b-B2]|uniref:DUF4268 domain-containing protein n=1 Tax=Polynucleobacter sp. JS-Safj-400b-B2 TaxID=2576921 RepID=UPI002104AD2A|nr:DUF4268 domain-containing protein [Polynucleobacter sp. JS-Safj-400b-B2]
MNLNALIKQKLDTPTTIMTKPINLGRLETLTMNQLMPGEATTFTPWLSQNIDLLSARLDMNLLVEGTEVDAGDFSADILARDVSTNKLVVIENQYGSTDHRHLGQILTYASMLDAQTVIWIAETIRIEHQATVNFLNQHLRSGLALYALEMSAICIDDSRPALSFNVVCAPNERFVKPAGDEISQTQMRYQAFFQRLIDVLRTQHQFTNARVGQPQGWYSFSSSNSKLYRYSVSFAAKSRIRVEVYIDSPERDLNKALLAALRERASHIEAAFGALGSCLQWEELETKRASRVALYREGSIDMPSEQLQEIEQWAVAQLLSFKRVFPTFIKEVMSELVKEHIAWEAYL